VRPRDALSPPWQAQASLFLTVPAVWVAAHRMEASFAVFCAGIGGCIVTALLIAAWMNHRARAEQERDRALRVLSGKPWDH
jgi:hypothetical protein